ncbi:hypothetical protein ACFQS7_06450 [Dankookia sp. GCM10030260]|uniref:hypothetical protein n=1 Tax=Dankookia sp. GCM10030260 TaxID=3273390 RepID=UPI0036195AD9
MSSHSVAEARERLPEPAVRALRGAPVVILGDGQVVAGAKQAGPVTPAALARLDRLRFTPAERPGIDAATLMRRLRDQGP